MKRNSMLLAIVLGALVMFGALAPRAQWGMTGTTPATAKFAKKNANWTAPSSATAFTAGRRITNDAIWNGRAKSAASHATVMIAIIMIVTTATATATAEAH